MRTMAVVLLCGMLVGAVSAQAPVISCANEGTHGGETLVLTGEGFVPGQTEVRVWTPETETLKLVPSGLPLMTQEILAKLHAGLGAPGAAPPATPPAEAVKARVLRMSEWGLACVLPEPVLLNTRVVWVGGGGQWSQPYVVNRAELWWTLPQYPSPGGVVEVFGRCLRRINNVGEATLVTLRHLPDGKPVELVEYANSGVVNGYTQRELQDGFWAKMMVPADFPTGPAELRAHSYTGGPIGWSAPLRVEVKAAAKPPTRVVNARQKGAVGDGLADDGPALQKAVQELAQAGGGVLYLPPGTYATGQTLVLGGKVTVRGAAKENTVVRGLPGVVMKELGAIFQGGSDWALENLSILAAVGDGSTAMKAVLCLPSAEFKWPPPEGQESAHWAIRRCRLESYTPPQGAPVSTDRGNAALFGLNVRDYEITDTEMVGFLFAAYYTNATYGRVERCSFRTLSPGGGGSIPAGRFVVLRDNIVDISARGMYPGWRECYVAWNVQSNIGRSDNAGETMLAENAFGPYWKGRPAAVERDAFTIPPAEWQAIERKPASWAGWVVTVTAGKGLGQVRDVVSAANGKVVVDQPWRVLPDGQSRLCLAASGRHLVLMGNVIRNGDAAIQLWGSSVECYVERTVDERTMGAMALAGYRGPVFWTEFRNNRVRERGTLGFGGAMEEGVAVLGNSLRMNEVLRPVPEAHTNQYYRGPAFSWMATAGLWVLSDRNAQGDQAQFNVVEGNTLWEMQRGVHLGPHTANNVVRNNTYMRVPEPVKDEGTGNVVQ